MAASQSEVLPEALVRLRKEIEAACQAELTDATPVELEAAGSALRWLSPPVPVNPDMEDESHAFSMDFEVTSPPSPTLDVFLVITLYLFGGEDSQPPLPGLVANAGVLLSGLNVLNAEEPGVKFRFVEAQGEDGIAWVVVEAAVEADMANSERIGRCVSRLLNCAESTYLEVEALAADQE
jgi:hypothetical protein